MYIQYNKYLYIKIAARGHLYWLYVLKPDYVFKNEESVCLIWLISREKERRDFKTLEERNLSIIHGIKQFSINSDSPTRLMYIYILITMLKNNNIYIVQNNKNIDYIDKNILINVILV